LARRTGGKKETIPAEEVSSRVLVAMNQMQEQLLQTALDRREAATLRGATREEFIRRMEGEGGLVYAGFCGSAECEQEIKAETKATIRVLPDEEFRSPVPPKTCLWCGRPSIAEAVWAKAY
jgi:prolyl-tRNA synthetase